MANAYSYSMNMNGLRPSYAPLKSCHEKTDRSTIAGYPTSSVWADAAEFVLSYFSAPNHSSTACTPACTPLISQRLEQTRLSQVNQNGTETSLARQTVSKNPGVQYVDIDFKFYGVQSAVLEKVRDKAQGWINPHLVIRLDDALVKVFPLRPDGNVRMQTKSMWPGWTVKNVPSDATLVGRIVDMPKHCTGIGWNHELFRSSITKTISDKISLKMARRPSTDVHASKNCYAYDGSMLQLPNKDQSGVASSMWKAIRVRKCTTPPHPTGSWFFGHLPGGEIDKPPESPASYRYVMCNDMFFFSHASAPVFVDSDLVPTHNAQSFLTGQFCLQPDCGWKIYQVRYQNNMFQYKNWTLHFTIDNIHSSYPNPQAETVWRQLLEPSDFSIRLCSTSQPSLGFTDRSTAAMWKRFFCGPQLPAQTTQGVNPKSRGQDAVSLSPQSRMRRCPSSTASIPELTSSPDSNATTMTGPISPISNNGGFSMITGIRGDSYRGQTSRTPASYAREMTKAKSISPPISTTHIPTARHAKHGGRRSTMTGAPAR